jgi:hypothetical protein
MAIASLSLPYPDLTNGYVITENEWNGQLNAIVNHINGQVKVAIDALQAVPPLPLTTKGDLLVRDGAATNVRLAVGADGKFLGASSAANAGVAWLDPINVFISPDNDLISAGTYAYVHGFGATPRKVWYALVCATSEYAYAVGDLIMGGAEGGLTVWCNSTQVGLVVSNAAQPIKVYSRITSSLVALTNANWKVRAYALK